MKERIEKKGYDLAGNFRKTPRSEPKSDWTKLERRGDVIVLAEPSNSTVSSIKHDYGLLKWELRKFDQYVNHHAEIGEVPETGMVKRDFKGTILVGDDEVVGYLTDTELNEFLRERKDKLGKSDIRITPISSCAEKIISSRWGFRYSTGATYIRRALPKKSRRSRRNPK